MARADAMSVIAGFATGVLVALLVAWIFFGVAGTVNLGAHPSVAGPGARTAPACSPAFCIGGAFPGRGR